MTQLKKYIWLVETIISAVRISHKELSDKWERTKELSDGRPLHRGTFNRWREAIFDNFGIEIKCQLRGGYLYYIDNSEDIGGDKLKKWILDSFSIGNLISESLSLKDRILVEPIPSGHNYLPTLLGAMKDNYKVKTFYQPYNKEQGKEYVLEPLCVRLFENRWYVLGLNNYNEIKIYALERIKSIETTRQSFKLPKDFDASEYFANYFGIVLDDSLKLQRIVIQANKQSKEYIKSLPLHHSQRLIEESEDYADFEFYLIPTYDFVMKLLRHGAMVEVLKPESLRDTMRGWIRDLHEIYKI